MKSTVTSKYQTTIPKMIREKLGIRVNDFLEWVVDEGRVVVHPVHRDFLRYRGSVKVGTGDIPAEIQAPWDSGLEKYR